MSIRFKPTPKKNPRDLEAASKYYATAISKDHVSLDVLAKNIADKSTANPGDTYAVIVTMVNQIMDDLAAGRSVDMGKLGKFSISLHSEGVNDPLELSSANILNARINYRPGPEMRDFLKTLKYEKEEG